ncbi:MAG TPA: TonB-dependent receptor [Phycisphaerae bacterium]|nr:TonB-dependent receptor [Phycisphaerae bacterium]
MTRILPLMAMAAIAAPWRASAQTTEPLPALPSLPQVSPAPPLANPPATATAPLTQAPATAHAAAASAATTQPVAATRPSTQPAAGATSLNKIVVSSDLDLIRSQIAPSLGAVTYTLGQKQIQNTPGGQNASFQQVLLRAPGVVEDSLGQVHVRGEHGNLTYRVNGVLLPEPLSGFGQELDTRLISSATLIDGTLPAQFGFRTAGIIDVQTKTGQTLQGSEVSIYGGSFDQLTSSFETGSSVKNLDYFFSGSYTHHDLGIENPTPFHHALHDYTDQEKFFSYLNYRFDSETRVSLLLNASYATFQLPDTPGLTPLFSLAGQPANGAAADSRLVNENQNEQEYYTVLSFQKTLDNFSFQASAFSRYGLLDFVPDFQNDLIFQGVAGQVYNNFVTNGLQFDSSLILNDQHTLRAGLLLDYTTENLDTQTAVFPTDADGNQLAASPLAIGDDSANRAMEAGAYIQDEWKLTPKLTVNYGLRLDRFDANFDHESQFSPRINLVFKADEYTTFHAGYARYFVPPPVQDIRSSTLNLFAGTTNAPENFMDGPPRVERSNYFDAGMTRQITRPWEVGFDAFFKHARNLVDLGQFGNAVILSPYNYQQGQVYGAEVSSTYTDGGLSLFGNFGWVVTSASNIVSQQFQFDNDELAYIADRNVKLDHESEFTVSAGAAYAWKDDRVYADILIGSGLRSGFANTGQQPAYYPVNVGYEHTFHADTWGRNSVKLRFDIVNLFDERYQLRSGSGLGVAAPQYGERRGFFLGMSYDF